MTGTKETGEWVAERVGRSVALRTRNVARIGRDFDNGSPENAREVEVGQPTQWSRFGPGYKATTSTVPTLPPGIYAVGVTPQGPWLMPRPLETDKLLRLPDTASDMVIGEVAHFWTKADEFARLGFVHKRGFLLHGPQGSGKTSTVEFIAGQHVADGGVVLLMTVHPETMIQAMRELRQIEPERRLMVIIEDLDAVIRVFDESNVLSMLDGEASIGGVVFMSTTNYPEQLAPRVTNRPSRFDRVIEIGMPSEAARRVYLESRDLGLDGADLARWVSLTKELSIAHLKEVIIAVRCYEMTVEAAVERMRGMARTPKSRENGGRPVAGFQGMAELGDYPGADDYPAGIPVR